MPYSTLYSVARAGTSNGLVSIADADPMQEGVGPTSTAYVVGVLPDGASVCHGQPGDAIPAGATVYQDGTAPWTWDAVADAFPALAAVVTPHDFYGESTVEGLTFSKFRCYAVLADAPTP